MQKRLGNDEFLETVRQLFAVAEDTGSVYLEQKRLSRTGPDAQLDAAASPYAVLFRASDGVRDKSRRTKVSTTVPADKLELFWQGYAECLKGGMKGLRRKDKKKQRLASHK